MHCIISPKYLVKCKWDAFAITCHLLSLNISYAHQGCIYLIKNTAKIVILCEIKCEHFLLLLLLILKTASYFLWKPLCSHSTIQKFCVINIYLFVCFSAVKRLIAINRIQYKIFSLHNICVCAVYIYYVYTHTYSIYFENIYMSVFIFI